MLRSLLTSLLALLLPVGIALAGDDPAPDGKFTIERVDLSSYAAPGGFHGPVLAAPSDLDASAGDGGQGPWSVSAQHERGTPRPVWLEFDGVEDAEEASTVSVDAVIELVRTTGLEDERLTLSSEGRTLILSGPAGLVARARARTEWALTVLAPSVRLRASLLAEGRDAGLKAEGAARLWPGRWTRLWLQENRPRFVVDWSVEIAQGSTAMNPDERALPEGQEAYVRWFPGETVSLLEVWSGDLEHLEVGELDLVGARNMPESSGPGVLRFPRTAVNRAYSALLFPSAGGTQEVAWQGAGGARRLRLRLDAAPASGAALPRDPEGQSHTAALRLGPSAAGLLFDSRPGRVEALTQELSTLTNGIWQEGPLGVLPGGGIGVARVPRAVLEAWTAFVKQEESALRTGRLEVRLVTVPEEAVRAALSDGTLGVDLPLPAGLVERLRQAGAVEGESVSLPLLTGVKAGFRCGASVPGLSGFDVEVAQESGAVDPLTAALFHGLSGEAHLSGSGERLHVRVDATVSWADPKSGTVTATYRPPVGSEFNRDHVGAEPTDVRRPVFPLLGGGSSEVRAEWDPSPKDGGERLLGLVPRGNDLVLVLASFRPS